LALKTEFTYRVNRLITVYIKDSKIQTIIYPGLATDAVRALSVSKRLRVAYLKGSRGSRGPRGLKNNYDCAGDSIIVSLW
jgi:hypothetical protein